MRKRNSCGDNIVGNGEMERRVCVLGGGGGYFKNTVTHSGRLFIATYMNMSHVL